MNARQRLVGWILPLATPERLRVYPRMLAIMTLLGFVLSFALGEGLLSISGKLLGADFAAFYTGGHFFLEGLPLYELDKQKLFQQSLVAPSNFNEIHPFINPPFTAILYSPLSLIPYKIAIIAWWILNISTLIITLIIIQSHIVKNKNSRDVILSGFLFFPTLMSFMYGQLSTLILLLFTLFFINLKKEKDFNAGFFLGVIAFKPQLIIIPIIILIWNRRWLSIFGIFFAISIYALLGFIFLYDEMWIYANMGDSILKMFRHPGYPSWGLQNLYGFFILLFINISEDLIIPFTFISTIIVTAILLIKWKPQPWEPNTRSWDFLMASTISISLIASLHLYSYDLMILLLPFHIVSGHFPNKNIDNDILFSISVIIYIFSFIGPYISNGQFLLCNLLGLPGVAVQITTMLILWWSFEVIRDEKIGRVPG